MTAKNYPQAKKRSKKKLPIKVSQKDFNKFIKPYLRKPVKGPAHKVSLYKIFNYILFVTHTGIQWSQLETYKNELHWSNVYKWHNRWSKDGSYQRLFESSVEYLNTMGEIDWSCLHGDGTNTVAKKGAKD